MWKAEKKIGMEKDKKKPKKKKNPVKEKTLLIEERKKNHKEKREKRGPRTDTKLCVKITKAGTIQRGTRNLEKTS